jgi:beta-phosphoglucomutase-like phosphatase (HAD superfamily)
LVAPSWTNALIIDLDGTLVDSVYAHVLAWQLAFAEAGIPIDGWRLHRRMGMSGGLFKRAVMRELGRTISMPRLKALDRRHGELFRQFLPKPRPLPGAVELLRFLRRNKIVHGIATSNQRPNINPSLKALGVTKDTVVVERGDVRGPSPSRTYSWSASSAWAWKLRTATWWVMPCGT